MVEEADGVKSGGTERTRSAFTRCAASQPPPTVSVVEEEEKGNRSRASRAILSVPLASGHRGCGLDRGRQAAGGITVGNPFSGSVDQSTSGDYL